MGIKGVTLIELLAAISLVIIVVVSMALFLPKAAQSTISIRYMTIAKNLAAGRIQEIKHQPYSYITPMNAGTFPNNGGPGGVAVAGCNCNLLDPASIPQDNSVVPLAANPVIADGITFTRQLCVNLVDTNWTSYCADGTSATDKGLKNVRVRVTWQLSVGSAPLAMETESVISR